jgi:hypothetical protein
MNDGDDARALVTRFYDELWNRWDDEAVEGVFAEGAERDKALGVWGAVAGAGGAIRRTPRFPAHSGS